MQWEFIVALAIVIPIILFPAVLIWYFNVGGMYLALKERRAMDAVTKKTLSTLGIIVPIGIYALAVWFFFGHFGWQVALALSLAFPLVFLVPVLVWAVIVSGLSLVLRDAILRRLSAPRRRAVRTAEEPVLNRTP